MSNEFDFNTGGGDAGQGGEQADESSAELSELALGPEKSNAGRNTAMILMTFALVGAATIYFMRLKSGPDAAMAKPPRETVEANRTVIDFLQTGSVGELEKLLKDTRRLMEIFEDKGKLVQVASEDLFRKGNPFQHKQPDEEELKRIAEQKRIEAEKAAEREREKAYKDAKADFSKLKLSFIMGGSKGYTCMINGVAYREGGIIENFLIVDIQPNSVKLRRKIEGHPDFEGTLKTAK
jgi:hypothetical protein